MTRIRGVVASLVVLVLAQSVAPQLRIARPESVSVSSATLVRMDAFVAADIEQRRLPGAVVMVGRKGRIVWRKAYGARALEPTREAMTLDTIFDLASLTKVVATATSIMILVERGKVRLDSSITRYIPQLSGKGRESVTIEHLLTHVSGYAPDFDLKERWSGYDEGIERLYREPLRNPPGTRFAYSDIGFIALGEVVARVSGMPLDQFAQKNIFEPLHMTNTGFRPSPALKSRIAPTERRGRMRYLGDNAASIAEPGEDWLRGEVHDPTSYRMNGVAGHAGLFSTANDLAMYCQMILNGGSYGGVRILSPLSIAEMTQPRIVTATGGFVRGLGWDMNSSYSANRGELFPLGSFGHTGFTGTSMWIDPASEMFVVFLSNRVHPDGGGDVGPLRSRIATIAAGAVTDTALVTRAREQSAKFYAESFKTIKQFSATEAASSVKVLNGIDVLERDNFKQLAGMRVGLVTNHTGRDREGRPTIDVLNKAPGVKLVALFSPEHGIRGLVDDKVGDSKDEATGLPIYSLYGESRRPKPEQLKELDALVYDIQDVGARFYTYISTLGYVMEEAAKVKLPVFVLDRPNPIGGLDVEGPIADSDKLSFISYHTIPTRHGLTIGELAQLFNRQRNIGADLRVIKMDGWRRWMWFDETNLTWVNPSPNMRSLTEATLYPGVGLLETTNVSVGRGTDTPFEVVGAPWIKGDQLAEYLNQRGLHGVRFVPVRFTPNASVFKDQSCGGVNIIITDRLTFRPLVTGMEMALALRELYPNDWQVDKYLRLLVNAETFDRVKRGAMIRDVLNGWTKGLDEFRRARAEFLLY
ncbi:MAG TPA: exo-beta-N-acetylmuramidase NamZ domain-containing protein [Pyrinomonadaceae bacterium]|nr:exo-beta-N-acetylmuramidase NamZ domain-containing protein [Pyrinomonadaceae bacterium]